MIRNKNLSLSISQFIDEQKGLHVDKSIRRNFGKNEKGFINLNTNHGSINIYTPELALVLTSTKIIAVDYEEKSNVIINGLNEFLPIFIEGYNEGLNYFSNKFEVNANTIYGENSKQYVRDLHSNYFHGQNDLNLLAQGWNYVKKEYPVFISYIVLKRHGFYSALVSKVDELITTHEKVFIDFHKHDHEITEKKDNPIKIEIRPTVKPETVQVLFEIIKDFFSLDDQTELKRILETGDNVINKLLFKDNGNRLTDTFKKLIEHDIITGCQKQHLEKWIVSNFLFFHNGIQKEFKTNVVNKYVSAGENTIGCKSPLIEINNGVIKKVEQPRNKKYNKY